MAYVINNTDGTAIVTITDGTVDNTTTVQLFGKSYSGFGEGLNENLVKLLENSASTSAPSAPLEGRAMVRHDNEPIESVRRHQFQTHRWSQGTDHTANVTVGGRSLAGQHQQSIVFLHGICLDIGRTTVYLRTDLSGWKIETVTASGVSKVISSMYVGNIRVAVLSKETFTPDAGSPLGFSFVDQWISNDQFGIDTEQQPWCCV
jgi:hypothetical protein